MIKQYSLNADSNKKLSEHFTVREFACRDGSDIIIIDDQLSTWLEQIRMFFYRPVYISSGFRTPSYNTAINGAKNSNHISGRAADFDVGLGKDLINPKVVAMYAETLRPRPGGLGVYQYADGRSWVHMDSGNPGMYWYSSQPGKPYNYRETWLPALRLQLLPIYRYETEVMQKMLAWLDLYTGRVDGKFGFKTDKAVLAFQRDRNLVQDGICGPVTWVTLFKAVKGWWE